MAAMASIAPCLLMGYINFMTSKNVCKLRDTLCKVPKQMSNSLKMKIVNYHKLNYSVFKIRYPNQLQVGKILLCSELVSKIAKSYQIFNLSLF